MNKIRVGILSDSIFILTGYRNQSTLLADYLYKKGFEIHYFANGYQGVNLNSATLEDGTILPYKIYGTNKLQYFQDTITELIKKNKIDFFIILLDTFMLYGNPNDGWFLRTDTSPAQTAFWFPSDGGNGIPKFCDRILRKVEYPVAMAEFGQKQVKDYYNLDVPFIPHGTNTKRFFRLSDTERENLKIKYGLAGKFVIGTVMRNQSRKMPDKFIKTFLSVVSKLKDKTSKDWICLMHTDFNDMAAPVDIPGLIGRYKLENRIIGTGMSALKGLTDDQMNEIYNLFDIFFLSTSGEGFGIPIIEAMSCEVPCIVTNYTTTEELIVKNNCGLGVKLVGVEDISFFDKNAKDYDEMVINGTTSGSWEVERGLIDIDDAADKIIQLMENDELRKTMGKNGRKAVIDKYDFEKVGNAWENLILKAVQKVT